VGGWRRTNIKGYLGEPLFVGGFQVFQQGHLMDQPKGERREVVSAVLACGHHKDVLGGVKEQLVDNVGRTDPRLTHTTESL
jgi:hypothetical protein